MTNIRKEIDTTKPVRIDSPILNIMRWPIDIAKALLRQRKFNK